MVASSGLKTHDAPAHWLILSSGAAVVVQVLLNGGETKRARSNEWIRRHFRGYRNVRQRCINIIPESRCEPNVNEKTGQPELHLGFGSVGRSETP